jgi:KEOPS complex subunit Pcc1
MIEEASAFIRLTFPSAKEAEIISKSVEPETAATLRYRSKVKVFRDGESTLLKFEAKDTTALRASINSYLSWLISLVNIYNFLESQK